MLKTEDLIPASSHLNAWKSHPLHRLGEPQQGEDEGHKANADSVLQLPCKKIQRTLPPQSDAGNRILTSLDTSDYSVSLTTQFPFKELLESSNYSLLLL